MTFAVTAVGAVLPSLLLLWFFYKRDLNPEPRGVLVKTFLLGVLIVIPVLIVALPMMFLVPLFPNAILQGAFMAFLCAAIPEEFFKFLVVTRYSARNPAFNEPMDGVVYGVTASLGFATLENILYVSQGGWPVALIRAFTAVPMHAFLGAIVGYYVGQARFKPRSGVSAGRGLLMGILFHGFYDFGVMVLLVTATNSQSEGSDPPFGNVGFVLGMLGLTVATFLTAGIWVWFLVSGLRKEQLQTITLESPQ